MLKTMEEFGIDAITNLCDEMHKKGYIMKDLNPAKKTKAVGCTDYRTVSLMSHGTKILLKIIKERIETG
jgi:hypothetical protein